MSDYQYSDHIATHVGTLLTLLRESDSELRPEGVIEIIEEVERQRAMFEKAYWDALNNHGRFVQVIAGICDGADDDLYEQSGFRSEEMPISTETGGTK